MVFTSKCAFILDRYVTSFKSIKRDSTLYNKDIVCVGYRWPSEALSREQLSLRTAARAAPSILVTLFVLGLGFFILPWVTHAFFDQPIRCFIEEAAHKVFAGFDER
jgi:hypothetical protein